VHRELHLSPGAVESPTAANESGGNGAALAEVLINIWHLRGKKRVRRRILIKNRRRTSAGEAEREVRPPCPGLEAETGGHRSPKGPLTLGLSPFLSL